MGSPSCAQPVLIRTGSRSICQHLRNGVERHSARSIAPLVRRSSPSYSDVAVGVPLIRTRVPSRKQPPGKEHPCVGTWRILSMELWAQDFVELEGRGFIRFDAGRDGQFHFVAVDGFLDPTFGERDNQPFVEFSWDGTDDADRVSGRGWATINGDRLTGRIYFHRGDSSGFSAQREATPPPRPRSPRRTGDAVP